MSNEANATEVAQETKVEKIILSSTPIQVTEERFVIFHNIEYVNPQIIDFITDFMKLDEILVDGCTSILFRIDGPPYEYDADNNEHVSALGAYNHETLSVVINLMGIFEKASTAIADGEATEAFHALMYHLLRRTVIHELIHGEDYVSAKNKKAWIENPGEEEVQSMAMLHLVEMAKRHPALIEVPNYQTAENWFDKSIVDSITAMREQSKPKQWEKDQLYMVDNHKIAQTEDGDYFTSIREYYRALADDGDDASWDTVVEETPVLIPEVTETSEVEKSEDVTPAAQTPEESVAKALQTGNMQLIADALAMLMGNPPVQEVTNTEVDAGAAIPTDDVPFDGGVTDAIAMGAPGSDLMAKMQTNMKQFGAQRPLTTDEQLIRNIFNTLFNEMFNKCGFDRGHWTTPIGILDPVTINLPGAANVIHSFDYTDGAGRYVKGELFGGVVKGQIDNRAGKLYRPAYVLHLKVAGQVITRRLQPVYVLNENGTMRDTPADKQATSLTYKAQHGTQVAVLRDPVEQKTKYNLIRQPDGTIKWEQWK
jgi:hypothetical protein